MGLEQTLRLELGEMGYRVFLGRLTAASKAMETIARHPELLKLWKGEPDMPGSLPPHVRQAFEAMLSAFADPQPDAPAVPQRKLRIVRGGSR